jgi:hypothetical protein
MLAMGLQHIMSAIYFMTGRFGVIVTIVYYARGHAFDPRPVLSLFSMYIGIFIHYLSVL